MAFQTGFGLIKPLRPRAAFANRDKLLVGLGGPGTDVPLTNSDVYYHEAHFPVSSARLLGTFKLDEPIYFKLALDHDTDVAIRSIGRNSRGLVTVASIDEAEPSIIIVKALAGGGGLATGKALENQHVQVLPNRAVLNSELPFLQFRDEGDVTQKSQIRSRRTGTGQQNAVTDWNCSADGRVYKVIITAGSKDIQILPGQWWDGDVNVHPLPFWTEAVVPHSFRGGQGVRIFGPAPGSPPLYTTVVSVNGATVTVADTPTWTSNPGAFCHDDTDTLQTAINNRGHLWLPEGRYWVRRKLLWPATGTGLNQQVIIEGDGEWRTAIVCNHDGNGLQLVGDQQTGNLNSGVYDAVIRNLGLWCVPDDSKEGIRATSMGHGLAFTATSTNGGVPGPSTGNVRVENVLLQGWGRWGLWSDNLQTAFLTNIKGYHNRSGAIALVGNATVRGTSQQEDNSIEIVNSLVVYSGPQDFGGGADPLKTLGGGVINAAAPRSLTVAGGLTGTDVGRIIKLVDGPGVNNSTHVTMIESVQSSTACTISMPVFQSAGTGLPGDPRPPFTVIVYQTCLANVFIHNANNVAIRGGTHQGNWVGYTGDAGGVRVEHTDAMRIDGLWEEDAGGEGGAAIDLIDCRAVSIDSSHTGGSIDIDPPITPSGHGVGIRIKDCQGVKVRGTYLGQSGGGTAFQMLGYCQGFEFENCYAPDWIAGLANTAGAVAAGSEPVIIGPGCHSLSFDNAQTNTLQLWDERWTNVIANPNFLDGLVGWTTPTAGVVTQPNYPYALLPARWERYVRVNTQALGAGQVDVLTQDVPIPDSRQVGQWTLAWDHYIESNGAGGATDNNTVVTIEVRTATAGYTVRSVTLTGAPAYGMPVGQWLRLCIKTNLDPGITGRFFRIRFSNAGTGNSPIFRVANVRLQPGISATFDADQPITQERGGSLYAPLYFRPIDVGQFPPPPPPAGAFSLVNIAGVLKLGSGGVYTTIATGGGIGPGTPNQFAMFGAAPGTTVVNAPAIATPSEVVFQGVGVRVENSKAFDTLYYTAWYCDLAQCTTDNIVKFGPTNDTVGGFNGNLVLLQAAGGARGQLWNNGVSGCLTYNADYTVNDASKSWGASALYMATIGTTPNQHGLTIHATPNTGYAGNFINCTASNLRLDQFVVGPDGNLAVIRRKAYEWPTGTIPPIDSTHPVKFLGYTNAGPPVVLGWLDPPGGTSSGVIISGTKDRFAIFNATGDNVVNGPAIATPSDLVVLGVGLRVENAREINTLYYTTNYCHLASCDTGNIVRFGPTNDTVGGSAGTFVLLQAAAGVGPRGQLWNDGVNGCLTYNETYTENNSSKSWGASALYLVTVGSTPAQHGLTIYATPATGYTGNFIQCLSTTLRLPKFVVGPDGDLDYIKGRAYTWPTAHAVGVLTNNGSGLLSWGGGAGNVSSTLGGTHLRIPRWDLVGYGTPPYTPPTFQLVDSAIEDRTGPGGNGTVQIDCTQLLFKRLNDGQDMSDFYMRSYTGANAAIRYENRAWSGGPPNPGVEDSFNTGGEVQVALGLVSAGAVPAVVLGSHHSWFKGAVRIKATSANVTGLGNAFEVAPYNSTTPNFAISQAGDLSIIKGVQYQWPSPIFSTVPPRFLQATYFGSAPGALLLSWVELATGSVGGSGTVNTLPLFTGTTPSSTLGNSQVTQDGAIVYVNSRDLQVIGDAAVADLAQLWLVGRPSNAYGVWRFEHRSVGIYDPVNTGGEIQARVNADVTHAAFGAKRAYFTSALRVRYPDTTDYPIAVCAPGGALTNYTFRVDTDGGLGIIRGVNYTWPGPITVYPTGGAYKYLGFNTTAGTPVLAWVDAPGGTGGGANVFLSNLSETTAGDHSTSGVAINTWVLPAFNADGTAANSINLGSPSKKFNAAYFYSGAFIYPAGSTETPPPGPRAFGFIPSATAFSTGEATRFLIYGDRNCFQSGDHCRTQICSYVGIELLGNTRNPAAPSFSRLLVATSEDTCVMLGSPNSCVGLFINMATTSLPLLKASVNGTVQFAVSNIGDLTVHGIAYLWPGSIPANNYLLQVQTSGQLAWVAPPTGGSGVAGTGTITTNALPKFTNAPSPYAITSSAVVDNGIQVNINSPFASLNSGVTKFSVNNQGMVQTFGGRQGFMRIWQPFGGYGGTQTETLDANQETVIVDTYNGGTGATLTLQLPDTAGAASTWDGKRWHFIMLRRDLPAGGGGTATNKLFITRTGGSDLINNMYTSITLDAGLSGQRDVFITCDARLHQWYVSPCYV
jgi:hypothetical protein